MRGLSLIGSLTSYRVRGFYTNFLGRRSDTLGDGRRSDTLGDGRRSDRLGDGRRKGSSEVELI